MEGLRTKPVWSLSDLPKDLVNRLENLRKNWKTVLEEARSLAEKEPDWLRDDDLAEWGDWKQLQVELYCGSADRLTG